jgi:hypothetical protein
MSSALRNVQLDIASRLRLAPFFWENGVSVLCPLMQDWEDQLEQELARIGRAAVVSIPDATSAAPSSGLFLDGVRVVITCIEDRSRNHANSSFAEEMAEVVACFLQHYRTEALHECLVFTGMADLLPERDSEDRQYREIAVTFKTSVNLSYAPTQTAAPTITQGATTTTITGASGAAFYYTVNGDLPHNTTGRLYVAAFANPAALVVVKARAYVADQIASDATSLTIT